ncbi:putative major tail subunit [Escherichia coli TW06591]|nr:putative major tail subunit [Escherichia coli TW06591]
MYAFKVQFPSGKGFKFLAEVRQHTWSSGPTAWWLQRFTR